MNRGFLIQAQTEDERPQAMALAYSIKILNKDAQVTLCVVNLVRLKIGMKSHLILLLNIHE